ncbi:hypothetical protein [Variovorax sp. DT-64]|uniref:hypothetical protein n=1 Tax=Variovorax sp. DT-64 TaxID=3396160 RepID=UPI003F53F898
MTITTPSMQPVTWSDLCEAGFWRSLAPQLCIGGVQSDVGTTPGQSTERLARRIRRMVISATAMR